MKEHKERLLDLIKMMKGIKKGIFDKYTKRCIPPLTEDEAKRYIDIETLISVRELTRMFVEELNSEYLQCEKDDEIVKFIEDIIEWLQLSYEYIIEGNNYSSGIKDLKICTQSLNDYRKIYNDAEIKFKDKDSGEFSLHYFSFGKKPKEQQYTSNTVQPITINLTFTGDSKENEITAEKLKNMIEKYSKDNGRRFV